LDVGAATSDDSHTLVKLTVVMVTQIWRARAKRPALCLHNDTSIGREWMAIVVFKRGHQKRRAYSGAPINKHITGANLICFEDCG